MLGIACNCSLGMLLPQLLSALNALASTGQYGLDVTGTLELAVLNSMMLVAQMVGVNFLMLLKQQGITGAILADEMGLGKTAQAICFLGTHSSCLLRRHISGLQLIVAMLPLIILLLYLVLCLQSMQGIVTRSIVYAKDIILHAKGHNAFGSDMT